MADFWVSMMDPDATMMNSKGEDTRLGYHTLCGGRGKGAHHLSRLGDSV